MKAAREVSFLERTIRAISITGSGGGAGVSVAVASINVYSNAIAYLEGDVVAENLTISAVSDYPPQPCGDDDRRHPALWPWARRWRWSTWVETPRPRSSATRRSRLPEPPN